MGFERPSTMEIIDRPLNTESMDNQTIETPLPSDILCGKNKECLDHPGSVDFRLVIEQNARRYQEADSKYMKMEITKQLYQQICQQSVRFLKYNSKAKGWQELTSSQVRDKIGHALRFANRRKRRSAAGVGGVGSPVTTKNIVKTHRRSRSDSSYGSSTSEHSTASENSMDGSGNNHDFGLTTSSPLGMSPFQKTYMGTPADEECLPVTKILRGLSKTLLKQIPTSISCAESLELLNRPSGKMSQFGTAELSEGDVMSMLREPVMEFEPKAVKPVLF